MISCNYDVTIWNRWRGEKQDVFYRHVIPVKCRYKEKITKTIFGVGAAMTTLMGNSQMVIMPVSELYRTPHEWNNMPPYEREAYFTLQIDDLVALGVIDIDITGVAPFREPEVRQMLHNVFSIKSIQDNTRVAKGKHYKIEGV